MMKRWLPTLLALALATAAHPSASAETDAEVGARRVALDLAGAFSNDGFKIRDGFWAGAVQPDAPAVVAVNLYAGNQYWFSVGAEQARKFAVRVYDENGQPVSAEGYEDEDKAAAGFSPSISGQYFVAIAPSEGAGGTYCLVYSYK
jgi:hypothetical protein